MIGEYASKGRCAQATGTSVETFPVSRPGQVVKLAVTINGVRGNFILDTGATFVSLRAGFAEKAKVDVNQDSSIKLHTANGIAEAKRGQAKLVQLRSLTASNVAVVVQDDAKATYGAAIDGLLGMSFLSRFNIAIEGNSLKIRARGQSSSR